jgi:alkanesulfonate monooxygenase SsuD/methylene tetrahydromethanopterin reductase-like flavin-dependent oxidoreductase (luciferase family)
MRYAVDLTGFGRYADAAVVAEAASAAEASGWDGLFIWDHLGWIGGIPCGDPLVSLTAAAVATERIRIGFDVTPLPRRRPQVVATAVAALDRLSGGRVTFGAGLGGDSTEFEAFGEDARPSVRAAKLDEALAILAGLWAGERVDHHGPHYTVRDGHLKPGPVQRPRPPIWIGGSAPAALRRAAAWDGYSAGTIADEHGNIVVGPDEIRSRVELISRGPEFEVAVVGISEPADHQRRNDYREAGATWWLECVHDLRGPLPAMLDRIKAGP